MKRRIQQVPSKLAKFSKAIAEVLPRGLPKDVKRFYGKTDGLKISAGGETFVLVGLAAMFGGATKGKFKKPVVAKRSDVDDLDWLALPHYERFFNEHGDVFDKKSLDQLNLRMRLALLSSFEGESTELAIDLHDGTIYVVDRADHAYALNDLSFDDFVAWFSKFGTHRWYFAFLDKKAEARMNIDLRAELERSLADFPAEEWAPLLARMPKPRVRRAEPVKASTATSSAVDPSSFPALAEAPSIIEAKDGPRTVWFSADGRTLLVWDGNYGLSAYGVASRQQLWRQKKAQRAALSPDGRTVAVLEHVSMSEHADRLVFRDLASGKAFHKKPWRPGVSLASLGWVGGGKVVVADTSDALHVVDASSNEAKHGPKVTNVRRLVGVGDTSRALVHVQKYEAGEMVLVGPSTVRLLDLETGASLTTWDGASTCAASPDGSLIALRWPTVVRVIEVATKRVACELPIACAEEDEDASYGVHLAFSGDGALLAISDRSYDAKTKDTTSAIRVHDATTGALVGRALLGTAQKYRPSIDAEGLAFSVDRIVCAGTGSFGLRFWRG